jgi:MSHA pilin protein MshC
MISSNKIPPRTSGFTLIELIIVIVILGVLVVVVANRVSLSKQSVANITAVDQAVADIQYTQMRAMANRGAVAGATMRIVFTSGSITYTIRDNAGNVVETMNLPADAPVGNSQTFIFNTLGELTGGANLSVTVGGSTITVYRVTGKVAVS